MGSVVSLEDGLTEQEEIVRVLQQKESANTFITVCIPNVILGVDCDIVFRVHHFEGLKQAKLITVNEGHSLLNSVLGLTTGGLNDAFNDR